MTAVDLMVTVIRKAQAGVDYSPRTGATCPGCGRRATVYRTMPWDDAIRIRYHRCESETCLVARCRTTIKSIEVDHVGGEK